MNSMTAGMEGGRNLLSEVAFLSRELKTPVINETFSALGDQAREEGWSHEEYLAAVLGRQVASRTANGTRMRIAVAIKAAEASYPVVFDSATRWIERLATAHTHGRLEAELRKLNRYRLLVIDLCRHRDYAEAAAVVGFQRRRCGFGVSA